MDDPPNTNAGMEKTPSKPFRFSRLQNNLLCLWIPVLLLLIATAVIRATDLDLVIARGLWSKQGGWRHATDEWVVFVYNFGVVPGLLIGVAALMTLLMGIGRMSIARYRKVAGFLLLTLLLGSGVLVNAVLKDHWGRPRPSQLEDFGGTMAFEPVLSIDPASSGKSFPCGHATMGFLFFAVAMAMPKAWRGARFATAAFGVGLGCCLGWIRMAQGGHFFSDVIWAAAIMWFVPLALFRWLKLAEGRIYVPKSPFKKSLSGWTSLAFAPLLLIGIALALLATPYNETANIKLPSPLESFTTLKLDVEGQVDMVEGETFRIDSQAEGFGMPNSSLRYRSNIKDGVLMVKTIRKGYFTELNAKTVVTIPAMSPIRMELGPDVVNKNR